MRQPWYFVLPEARFQPSGGNIYNERLIEALVRAGQPLEIMPINNYIHAIQEDRAGVYWVDTLLLEQLSDLLSLRPQQARSLLIVHHLNSMSPSNGQSLAKGTPGSSESRGTNSLAGSVVVDREF